MKKILVTGASGYIGRHVVEQLVKDNVEVIAVDINLDNLPNNVEKKRFLFLQEKKIFIKKWEVQMYVFILRGRMVLDITRMSIWEIFQNIMNLLKICFREV